MLVPDPLVATADLIDAIKTFLRIEGDDDDPMLAALGVSALASSEAHIGEALIERGFTETRDIGTCWVQLAAGPVVSITSVRGTDGSGLPIESYGVDLDDGGGGRVRLTGGPARRVVIAYRAGRAARWSALDEPLRHGVVRLVAHRFASRETGVASSDAAMPGDVTALWRSARRLRLS